MDFDLSEEQSMLKDGLDRMLANEYGFESRRKHMAEPEGYSQAMWERYAEMGLMMLPFAEAGAACGAAAGVLAIAHGPHSKPEEQARNKEKGYHRLGARLGFEDPSGHLRIYSPLIVFLLKWLISWSGKP